MPGMVTTEFARNALGGTPAVSWAAASPGAAAGAGAAAPPRVQVPEEVADAIAALIAEPREELYTQAVQSEQVRRYYEDVGAFERSLGAR